MESNKVNRYIYKVLDNFPYDLEGSMENLEYALSVDPENPIALTLMGRFYSEIINDYEEAKIYFEMAMAADINCLKIYPSYIKVLLWNEEYDELKRLLNFCLKIQGLNKGGLYLSKAIMFEQLFNYKEALKYIKKARIETYNSDFMYEVEEQEKRINAKIKLTKKKGKKPKSKKKKKGKK